MPEVSWEFIAQQLERVLTELGSLRDELRVQGAITRRIDNTTQRHESTTLSLLEELRAIDCVRKLEDAR